MLFSYDLSPLVIVKTPRGQAFAPPFLPFSLLSFPLLSPLPVLLFLLLRELFQVSVIYVGCFM